MKSALRSLGLFLLLALPLAAPAGATTYWMMSDQALADQSAAVVDVKVIGVDSAPLVDGPPATDYLVEVNRVVKGDLSGSTIVVRVPGGVNPLGVGLKIWGAPRFEEGENALLFVRPAQDGTYRILHLMLGAFHKRILDGRAVALRDLSEAHEVGQKGEEGIDDVRDFERFADWVADRAEGIPNAGGYALGKAKAQLQPIAGSFSFLTPADGTPIRWFRFDGGQTVEFRVNEAGQPGLGLAATIDAFKVALDAWTSDPGTGIRYVYAGTTPAAGGLANSDRVNTILFDDPYRDDPDDAVEGSFSCDGGGGGGVIAMGGPWFFASTRAFQGKRYHEAAEADIVTNDGTECFFRDNPRVAEEVFAHELGHTLGLGHSTQRGALMYSFAHNDGRGALLADDDRAAVAALYGTGGGSGTVRLAAPARLTARATKSTEVALTWRDKAAGEESYRVEVKRKGQPWQEVLSLPAGATSAVVPDLLPRTTYFFRVRAAAGNRFSTYSNVVTVVTPR
jgi:hypothetical protein